MAFSHLRTWLISTATSLAPWALALICPLQTPSRNPCLACIDERRREPGQQQLLVRQLANQPVLTLAAAWLLLQLHCLDQQQQQQQLLLLPGGRGYCGRVDDQTAYLSSMGRMMAPAAGVAAM